MTRNCEGGRRQNEWGKIKKGTAGRFHSISVQDFYFKSPKLFTNLKTIFMADGN